MTPKAAADFLAGVLIAQGPDSAAYVAQELARDAVVLAEFLKLVRARRAERVKEIPFASDKPTSPIKTTP